MTPDVPPQADDLQRHAAQQQWLGRKGAPRIADIAPELLQALNRGWVPTVNLVEFLAIDLSALTRQVAQDIGLDPQSERLQDMLAMLPFLKPMQRHGAIARALYAQTAALTAPQQRDRVANGLACHTSDMARSWAANWLAFSGQSLADKLGAVQRFAADPHFGVREMAWAALRNDVIAELDQALHLLQAWVTQDDPLLRRFASEITRPRGVWCAQIDVLKQAPWKGEPLLTPLRSDPSRYVQDSVANWLNDASKSQPAWVQDVCARWSRSSDSAATRYVVQRALRTLRKQG